VTPDARRAWLVRGLEQMRIVLPQPLIVMTWRLAAETSADCGSAAANGLRGRLSTRLLGTRPAAP
jgi:hypothetical protein